MPITDRHPSILYLDASKIKSYMDCPRAFFYRYVLGWRPESFRSKKDLVFGRAIHVALEHLIKSKMNPNSLDEAYDLFLKDYRAEPEFTPETDGMREPKTPERARKALEIYLSTYQQDKDAEVLHTESSGKVYITEDYSLLFRVDAILKDKRGIYILEHKTASRLSQSWLDQWSLSVQVGLYMHLLMTMYPPDEVWGAIINGLFFYKSKDPIVQRVPIKLNIRWLNQWRLNMLSWIESIQEDFDLVDREYDQGVRVMRSFRMNTESCNKYYGCPFRDFCISWENPLEHAEEPPLGFTQEWWDPRDLDSSNKVKPKSLGKQLEIPFPSKG